jgi:hypothetical protein
MMGSSASVNEADMKSDLDKVEKIAAMVPNDHKVEKIAAIVPNDQKQTTTGPVSFATLTELVWSGKSIHSKTKDVTQWLSVRLRFSLEPWDVKCLDVRATSQQRSDTMTFLSSCPFEGHITGTGISSWSGLLLPFSIVGKFDQKTGSVVMCKHHHTSGITNTNYYQCQVHGGHLPTDISLFGYEKSEHFMELRPVRPSDSKKQPEHELCSVCFINARDCLLRPCNHFGFCHECGCVVQKCPVCNAVIKQRLHVYCV